MLAYLTAELRRLAWSGTPSEVRPIVWQLLLVSPKAVTQRVIPDPSPELSSITYSASTHHPVSKAERVLPVGGPVLRPRNSWFGSTGASRSTLRSVVWCSSLTPQIWHQIEIDVPRTRPGAPLWSCLTAQRSLERILYVWAIRHPASGYVQGINDLVCPFFQVFLSAYIGRRLLAEARAKLIRQIPTRSCLTSPTYHLQSSLLSKRIRSGVSPNCSMGYKTTTSHNNRVYSGLSSG